MSNEQYLIVSYFAVGLLLVGVGWLTYLWLRPSFKGITSAVPGRRYSTILGRLFCLGILLPALFGFLSVSYTSCSKTSYEKVIESRSYLIAMNQAQLSNTLEKIVMALFVWGFIILFALAAARRDSAKSKT